MTIAQDIETAQCELTEWQAALAAARGGSSYTIDGVTVSRQDVRAVIRPQINRLRRSIKQLQAAQAGASAPSVRQAVLRDPWA